MCGVTVRALHHYERVGLLKPRRTPAGYRVYEDRDIERLEQIVALKWLGAPLGRIRELLEKRPLELADALRAQRRVLEEKRRMLDRAIRAIAEAEKQVKAGGAEKSVAMLKTVMEAIQMEKQTQWMDQYYSGGAQAKVEARKPLWSPELQERVSKQWADLIADVEASLGEDPAGEKGLALAARWMALVNEFTGGDREIEAGVGNMWADRANWPADTNAKAPAIRPEVWAFIRKAMGAGGK